MTPAPICRYGQTLNWLRWMASELRKSNYGGVQRAGAEMINTIDEALAHPCGCVPHETRKNKAQGGKVCTTVRCGRPSRALGLCSRCYVRQWRRKVPVKVA